MASQSDEFFILTDAQLTEVCVQFAAVMGWVDAPGTPEWYKQLRSHGGPKRFGRLMARARQVAVDRVGDTFDPEASPSFQDSWGG